jgi:hypothetical protein
MPSKAKRILQPRAGTPETKQPGNLDKINVSGPIETRNLVLKESKDLKRELLPIVKNTRVPFFPDQPP